MSVVDLQNLKQTLMDSGNQIVETLLQTETYAQLAMVLLIFIVALLISNRLRNYFPLIAKAPTGAQLSPLRKLSSKMGNLLFPLIAILALSFAVSISENLLGQTWLVQTALTVAMLLVFNAIIRDHVSSEFIAFVFRWIGLPLLFLHQVNLLAPIINVLEGMQITVGNIQISAYGVLRVALFGTLLFWMGRFSSSTGKEIIRRQQKLDFRAKEVASKLLEVAIFFLIFILLLQVMGINLTAMAVFGGALGVGIGFGLQAIASNFISGIIILLDRSISVDDYIELEDGRTGIVREMKLRSTTLETFDGKDVMVPNEKFVTESFINWTHKDKKQRYRVDFSVAYDSDIRKLVDIIKETVASHEQVISGDDIPIEERPDCEIDSFGDSGVNMFVEFWMIGIDDGKNRVGGDLLLLIFEAMRNNGFTIPFPQREVRVLKE
jgi:small-conductance mechanosensitive channel